MRDYTGYVVILLLWVRTKHQAQRTITCIITAASSTTASCTVTAEAGSKFDACTTKGAASRTSASIVVQAVVMVAAAVIIKAWVVELRSLLRLCLLHCCCTELSYPKTCGVRKQTLDVCLIFAAWLESCWRWVFSLFCGQALVMHNWQNIEDIYNMPYA